MLVVILIVGKYLLYFEFYEFLSVPAILASHLRRPP